MKTPDNAPATDSLRICRKSSFAFTPGLSPVVAPVEIARNRFKGNYIVDLPSPRRGRQVRLKARVVREVKVLSR